MSLAELTALCQRVTGNLLPVGAQPETAAVEIPFFFAGTELL